MFCFFFKFWPHNSWEPYLVPSPGIEPMAPAVEAWRPHHWTTREIPASGTLHLLFPPLECSPPRSLRSSLSPRPSFSPKAAFSGSPGLTPREDSTPSPPVTPLPLFCSIFSHLIYHPLRRVAYVFLCLFTGFLQVRWNLFSKVSASRTVPGTRVVGF